jgi:hypothetical protein
MDFKTQDKVNELVYLFASSLKLECQRLYHSGDIDISRFDFSQYALSKVLLTAALHRMKDEYTPPIHNPKLKDDVINLIKM